MKLERHEMIIRQIDAELERPYISVPEALKEAVIRGTMSISEAGECLEAYLKNNQGDIE